MDRQMWLAAVAGAGLLASNGGQAMSSARTRSEDKAATAAELVGRREPVPRRDAYFGLHFDLHPQKGDTVLGADITQADLADLLTRVRPDYIQYDCKGHAGYTGYPTRVGWASPGIVQDSLALWRQATREHGVGLFVHYSGVWDTVAIEHHPEWARIGPDGKPDPNNTSTFGPYVDELLIPQLTEAAKLYDLDGAWVDGECWAVQLDWSPAALAAWRRETGYADAPRKRDEAHWLEWKMFHRRQFELYLCRWVDAVHAACPKMQLTSNWMYTTLAPKPVVAKLDYLSGDYSPTLSVDRARVEARYLASTQMPWDLLAWGFNWVDGQGHSLKPAVHLEQEAAVVIMQGGGFSVYYQPTRSGYVVPEVTGAMAEVAEFARARQAVSHQSTTVPQVALLLSSETQFDRSDAVFTAYGCVDELEGALHALLECHYSVDILAEHQLAPRLSEYPVVVVPDAYKLSDEFRAALTAYVAAGGSLFLMGEKCARLFEPILGVTLQGTPQNVPGELTTPAGVVNAAGLWQAVIPVTAEVLATRHPTRDTRRDGEPAVTWVRHGQGQVAAAFGPLAIDYFRAHQPALRQLVGQVMRRLLPAPAVEVDAPPCVEVALRRSRDGRLSVHLLNTAGMPVGNRHITTDFIPPVGPLTVRLRSAQKPARVRWVPDGGRVRWQWADGVLTATLPQVQIHGVLVVE